METPVVLEPQIAAFIGDWTWTVPDYNTLLSSYEIGDVILSPDQSYKICSQEFTFAYEMKKANYWATFRLINKSKTEVRIRDSDKVMTLSPGEGADLDEDHLSYERDGFTLKNSFFVLLEKSPLQRDMLNLLDEPEDCDFWMVCEDQKFSCHKHILKARLPVLAEAIQAKSSEFKIEGFKPDSVKKMLEFIYSDSIRGEADADVFKLAIFMHVEGLIELCRLTLAKSISKDNVFDLLELAESVAEGKFLREKAVEFLAKNYLDLEEAPQWKNLTLKHIKDVMKMMSIKKRPLFSMCFSDLI